MRRDQNTYDRIERALQGPMVALSLLFLPVLLAPALIDVGDGAAVALNVFAWLIWAAFAAEYLLLLYLAPSRVQMVRTHMLDLAIIVLPFLRPLRALRSLRAIAVLGRAFTGVRSIASRRGFRSFIGVTAGLIIAGGVLTWVFERYHPDSTIATPTDALWWAIVTSTTVGYGDHAPVTAEGRGIAVVLMLVGVALLSVVTANVAAYIVGNDQDDADRRLDRIERSLAEIRDRLDT